MEETTMKETDRLTILLRDHRALARHAFKVNAGDRETGNGQDEEEFCVELGMGWITWFLNLPPTTGVSESTLRKELTKQLSPEKMANILSMGSLKKVEIHFLLWSQPTPLSLATSYSLSKSLSSSRNLTHLDLCGKYDNARCEFCLALHATQLGESLKNLPLECLNIWGVLQDCSLAIRPLVESSTCRLQFLGFKDKFIPGHNTTNEWCASIEEATAVMKACKNVATLKELHVGGFRDVDTAWDSNRQQLRILGRFEPDIAFFVQLASLLKSPDCPLEKLTMEVNSRASLLEAFDALAHNDRLKELKVKDWRKHLMSCIEYHANEMKALYVSMKDNTTLESIDIQRLGLYTSLPHNFSVQRWIENSSLSAQGRVYHESIHFYCTFNLLGRGTFVEGVHDADSLPGASEPDSNQLIEKIGSVQFPDSIHLSSVYELLKANTSIIFKSNLPPHDTVAKKVKSHERDCHVYPSIYSNKPRRRTVKKDSKRPGKIFRETQEIIDGNNLPASVGSRKRRRRK